MIVTQRKQCVCVYLCVCVCGPPNLSSCVGECGCVCRQSLSAAADLCWVTLYPLFIPHTIISCQCVGKLLHQTEEQFDTGSTPLLSLCTWVGRGIRIKLNWSPPGQTIDFVHFICHLNKNFPPWATFVKKPADMDKNVAQKMNWCRFSCWFPWVKTCQNTNRRLDFFI